MTTVAFTEEDLANPPTECGVCGKPVEQWGNTRPWRTDVTDHQLGCREHPETQRCIECGEVMIDVVSYGSNGPRHVACEPGALIQGSDGVWRDRYGNVVNNPWA